MSYKFLESFGIELEYMVVDRQHFNVSPVVDHLFQKTVGQKTNVVENEYIDWSNELVRHVLEFKNNTPTNNFQLLNAEFQSQIQRANRELLSFNSQLMPSAMHPWMNPDFDTQLWPFENKEIYKTYDRIFNCKGHGWSNLQSMHMNIAFNSSEEFHRLHSAIRFVLPLIPILSSSSPIVEDQVTGAKSNRLKFYLKNQKRIPSIIGLAIPDVSHSPEEYQEKVLSKMYQDIAPYDTEGVLQEEWLNSRGAIPKFERGCIEIRLADVQEACVIDLSIAQFWFKLLQKIVFEQWIDLTVMDRVATQKLRSLLDGAVEHAESMIINDEEYLSIWGLKENKLSSKELLHFILDKLHYHTDESMFLQTIQKLLEVGSLSTRITNQLGDSYNRADLESIYHQLCICLDRGIFFEA